MTADTAALFQELDDANLHHETGLASIRLMHCTMIIFIFVMIMSVAIITMITMAMTMITTIMMITMITIRQKHNAIIADLGDQIDQLNKGGTLYMIVSVFC